MVSPTYQPISKQPKRYKYETGSVQIPMRRSRLETSKPASAYPGWEKTQLQGKIDDIKRKTKNNKYPENFNLLTYAAIKTRNIKTINKIHKNIDNINYILKSIDDIKFSEDTADSFVDTIISLNEKKIVKLREHIDKIGNVQIELNKRHGTKPVDKQWLTDLDNAFTNLTPKNIELIDRAYKGKEKIEFYMEG